MVIRRKSSAPATPGSSSPGTSSVGRSLGAGGDQDGIVAGVPKLFQVFHARAGRDFHVQGGEIADIVVDDLVGKTVGRDGHTEHTAGLRGRLKDLDPVAPQPELPGGGEAGWAGTDDGDAFAVVAGGLHGRRGVPEP